MPDPAGLPARSDSAGLPARSDSAGLPESRSGRGRGTTTAGRPAASPSGLVKARSAIVAAAVPAAVVVNLLVYAVGRAAGGTFRFTANGTPAEVNAVTVAGFSALPPAVGLIAVALLARHRWALTTALVAGPALAVLTIVIMTIPADLDTTSTITLALCHLTLVPITVVAIRRLAATARLR